MGQFDPIDTSKPAPSTEILPATFWFKVDDHGQNDFVYVNINVIDETNPQLSELNIVLNAPVSAFQYNNCLWNHRYRIELQAFDDIGNGGNILEHTWIPELVMRFQDGTPVLFANGGKITYA